MMMMVMRRLFPDNKLVRDLKTNSIVCCVMRLCQHGVQFLGKKYRSISPILLEMFRWNFYTANCRLPPLPPPTARPPTMTLPQPAQPAGRRGRRWATRATVPRNQLIRNAETRMLVTLRVAPLRPWSRLRAMCSWRPTKRRWPERESHATDFSQGQRPRSTRSEIANDDASSKTSAYR